MSKMDSGAIAEAWNVDDVPTGSRIISRIEDLPDLEAVGSGDVRWVVEGIFVEGALHMITSEPGAGKSTLMSALAHAVSRGQDFIGRATSHRPVLLLDAENPLPAVRERFGRLGITTHEDFRVWGQWVGEDPPAAGGSTVLEWVARCDPKPLIIIDSVIAFHPGAENDSNETRRQMAQYRTLTTLGATPVLLHHTGKGESSREYRGSSDYKAAIDIGYKLINLGDGTRLTTLELKPFKQRISAAPLLQVRYDDGVFSEVQVAVRKSTTELLIDLLKENPGATQSLFERLAINMGIGRSAGRQFLKSAAVRVEKGTANRALHYWVGRSADPKSIIG
jgi:hypothetical protein